MTAVYNRRDRCTTNHSKKSLCTLYNGGGGMFSGVPELIRGAFSGVASGPVGVFGAGANQGGVNPFSLQNCKNAFQREKIPLKLPIKERGIYKINILKRVYGKCIYVREKSRLKINNKIRVFDLAVKSCYVAEKVDAIVTCRTCLLCHWWTVKNALNDLAKA